MTPITDFSGDIYLWEVHVDSQGYDKNGKYFGVGDPLFQYSNEDGDIDAVLRAKSLKAAKAQVLAIYPKALITIDGLQTFLLAYQTCALWSSIDEVGESSSVDDISEVTAKQMRVDCQAFLDDHAEDIGDHLARAGQDFWLTRNGHGAGFWDGDWEKEAGARMTKDAKVYGGVDLYVDEDGKVHSN
jgi:hypothetical protein